MLTYVTYGVQEWQEARKEKLLLRTQRLREEEEAQLAAARVRATAFEFAPRKVLRRLYSDLLSRY
jgi:hypothetical protein